MINKYSTQSSLLINASLRLRSRLSELNDLIVKLVTHLNKLRELRIGNICETLDVEGGKNKLEIENNKLYKEILKLNRLVVKLKQKQKKSII